MIAFEEHGVLEWLQILVLSMPNEKGTIHLAHLSGSITGREAWLAVNPLIAGSNLNRGWTV